MLQSPSLAARFACFFYEVLTTLAVLLVGFLVPHIVLGLIGHPVTEQRALVAHVFLLLAVYFVWQWLAGGQTLPMKTWRIQLTSADGKRLGLGQALLRYALAWPSLMLFGVGLLWSLFDRDRQFLHDRLAGTRLVRLPKPTA
jgi:uncharacterized RDD family membrane protein YckC